jgi:hypothetical protein
MSTVRTWVKWDSCKNKQRQGYFNIGKWHWLHGDGTACGGMAHSATRIEVPFDAKVQETSEIPENACCGCVRAIRRSTTIYDIYREVIADLDISPETEEEIFSVVCKTVTMAEDCIELRWRIMVNLRVRGLSYPEIGIVCGCSQSSPINACKRFMQRAATGKMVQHRDGTEIARRGWATRFRPGWQHPRRQPRATIVPVVLH